MNKIEVSLLIPLKMENNQKFIWMQKRETLDFLEGALEFVGGKINENENALDACIRESEEEIGLKIKKESLSFLKKYSHIYAGLEVGLHCFLLREHLEELPFNGWFEITESSIKQISKMIPPANIQIINDLFLT